jgi:hypothetical protein
MTSPKPLPGAGEALAQAYEELDTLPVAEAARRAYTPTGPPLAELEQRIRTRRELTGKAAS